MKALNTHDTLIQMGACFPPAAEVKVTMTRPAAGISMQWEWRVNATSPLIHYGVGFSSEVLERVGDLQVFVGGILKHAQVEMNR